MHRNKNEVTHDIRNHFRFCSHPGRALGSYTLLLRTAFDQICNKTDWKGPVNALVPWGAANVYIQAIEHMTSAPVDCCRTERLQRPVHGELHGLRDALLKNQKIALKTMWGDSAYEAVMPEQQTDFAMQKGVKEVQSTMRTMRTILVNTPVHLLSADAQRKSADAQAKVAMLAGMATRRTLLR